MLGCFQVCYEDKDDHTITRQRYREDKHRTLKAYTEGTFRIRDRFKIRREPTQFYTHQYPESREIERDAHTTATLSSHKDQNDLVIQILKPKVDNKILKHRKLPEKVTEQHLENINQTTQKSLDGNKKLLLIKEVQDTIENYKKEFKKFYGTESPHIK